MTDANNDDDPSARAITPSPNNAAHATNAPDAAPDGSPNDNSGGAPFDPHAGRRLLSTTYRDFAPSELEARYVSFLLGNERTRAALQGHVVMDHMAIVRQNGGENDWGDFGDFGFGENDATNNVGSSTGGTQHAEAPETNKRRQAAASIEIDAFQLISLDPVLGNLTLRYPDTLLIVLEDSTVEARQVLRGRIEAAMQQSLERMKRQKTDMRVKNDDFKREVNRMIHLLKALKFTSGREGGYDPRPLHARLVHLPPHSQFCKPTLSSISAADVGTVVQICGTCVRTGPVRMMETVRTYRCLGKECGYEFSIHADFGTTNNSLQQPVICPLANVMDGEPCLSNNFAVVPERTETADYQEMKVQESASALNRVGSVPRSILIKLSDDLVDVCNPGDEVVVVGELQAAWSGNSVGASVEVMVGMSMKAHSVRVINVDEGAASGGGAAGLGLGAGEGASGNLREKFRREFDAFWSDAAAVARPIATRDYIVRAICPKLYGMHAVKLGLLLVLIGGAAVSSQDEDDAVALDDGADDQQKKENGSNGFESDEEAPVAFNFGGNDDDGDDDDDSPNNERKKPGKGKQGKGETAIKSRRRIQSHILLIGDPGTGKSQFLRFAAALSPRSVLTTGTGSSRAGLTCAAVRDSSSAGSNGNEFSLEAGALALADRGVCCIDEFGCMSKEDRTSIHEAMEQQTISVAKAGIICKLNARATVVAVMNPKDGIYDDALSLEQNSRLGSALLSRFDLVFKMMDQAVTERDANIAHFLLQQSIIPGSGYERPVEMEALSNDDTANGHWGMEKLRAYIATVREKFHPTLTPEASDLLQRHYSMCRQQSMSSVEGAGGHSLITVRFLESLIRLSQAHARLMYRDKVELDDAVAIILLMECTAASGMFNSFDYLPGEDPLRKNPIDTEFKPFDASDEVFGYEKQELLSRYENKQSPSGNDRRGYGNSNNRAWDDFEQQSGGHFMPSYTQNAVGGNSIRDQYDRPISMSQAPSPYPSSQRNPFQRAGVAHDEYKSQGSRQRSAKKVTFSQARSSDYAGYPDEDGYYDIGSENDMQNPQHMSQQEYHPDHAQQWETSHSQAHSSQQCNDASFSQQSSSSGKKRKKRRTAD